jgi:hypothetical protein
MEGVYSEEYELRTSDTNGITMYGEYDVEEWGWRRSEYDPPLNYLAGEVSIGTKKTGSSTMKYTDSEGISEIEGTIFWETTVEGVEDVTVPAGTFENCLKIKIIYNMVSSDVSDTESGEITMWLAKGVGMVKQSHEETETEDGDVETSTSTDELVSATVGGVAIRN